jgi:osmoprotectant transport system ATP-binding protein
VNHASPSVAPAGDPIIALDRVVKSFDGGSTHAIRSVSLRVERGAFVAIVGPSGCGKTTTLKTINRLVEPDCGSIRVEARSVAELAPWALRRRIGYVFQGIGLFPHLTVAENIGITPRLLGWNRDAVAARTAELMELVSLPVAYGPRMPRELSGGQRQRVGVARALAAKPSIMLMDEPFGALDPVTRDALGTQYLRLHRQMGLTTLMVTHDVLEAVLLADRIVVMRAGAIVADGTPRELLEYRDDAEVSELMQMPRRQAMRVRALLEGSDPHE